MDIDRRMAEIPIAIRRWRMGRGLSQRELAGMLGMSPAALNRIENGNGNMQISTLFKIADALDADPILLMGRSAQDKCALWDQIHGFHPSITKSIIELLDQIRDLDVARELAQKELVEMKTRMPRLFPDEETG